MHEFVLSAIRLLADVPGAILSDDEEHPLRALDVVDLQMRFDALSENEREYMAEQWSKLHALVAKQRSIHAEAHELIQAMTEKLIRLAPFDVDADAFLREHAVQLELEQIIAQLAGEGSKVLLSIARCIHEREHSVMRPRKEH